MPRAARSLRRVLRERHAVDLDRARIGHVHAVKHFQDGRLTGTVAAEQRMNLALLDPEIHIDESLDAAEGFGYAPHRHGVNGRGDAHQATSRLR